MDERRERKIEKETETGRRGKQKTERERDIQSEGEKKRKTFYKKVMNKLKK